MAAENAMLGGGGAAETASTANPWMAGGLAGAAILKELMAGIAARKRQERGAKVKSHMASGQMQSQAHGQSGAGQQNALGQLMNAYRDSLVR